MVEHLPRVKSDHNALCLQWMGIPASASMLPRPFRFQAVWLTHARFKTLVEIAWRGANNFQNALSVLKSSIIDWNKNVFGHILVRKRSLISRLNGIQKALAARHSDRLMELDKELRDEFSVVLEQEELMWFQKSRSKCLQYGDRNTGFFHSLVASRRKRQFISQLQDENGVIMTDQGQLGLMAQDYFRQLFTAEHVQETSTYLSGFFPSLTDVAKEQLAREVTIEEVKAAVFSLGAMKAPGPDGFHAIFYQSEWDILKQSFFEWVVSIFNGSSSVQEVNETLLCLIPKVNPPQLISQFRPIGLCNVSYKVIIKLLVHCLKSLMPTVVGENQTSFIPGRHMVDNILVAQEVMHSFHIKRSGKGFMAIKVDLEKAYDRLSWSFIRNTLQELGLPYNMIRLIMDCVSTSSMSVLWKGSITEKFLP